MKSRLAFLVFAAVALGGCVSTGTYDAKVAELEACQTRHLAEQEKAKTELDKTIAEQNELDAALQRTKSEFEACQKASESARQYAETLKQREADLRSRLQKEMSDKEVEISQLRGQLNVRVLDKILFRSGSADILPAGQAVLDKVARVLETTDDQIRVEGHTDNVPISDRLKSKYFSNWELSAARAASVVRYFQHGSAKIDPTRLEAVGYAEYQPVAPNDNDADRQRNRRVEIVLTAKKPPAEPEPASPETAPSPAQ
jgi:chemotaxis protein MotB